MRHVLAAVVTSLALALPAGAAEMGDDGLHKADWMRDTFKDLREDLAEAGAEDKRLMLLIEQRGCIYCKKMHEEVFSDPEVKALIEDHFFVVQVNMFGDTEMTDLDGEAMPEKDMVRRWGALFTPTMIILPEEAPEGATAAEVAVANMPGAFSKNTTAHLLEWVLAHGYEGDEPFQKYHARRLAEEGS